MGIGARYQPGSLEVIQAAIEPGGSILALHDFTYYFNDSFTAVITEQYLYFMTFRNSRSKGLVICKSEMQPVSRLSSISVGPRVTRLKVTLTSDQGQRIFYSIHSKYNDFAMEFINVLRGQMQRKEMQQGSLSIAEEIEKLAQLTNEGILTDDELTRAKEMFLGRPPSELGQSIDQSLRLLRNLHELKRQGVLSESEFNMKKWDILSKKDFS